MKEKKISDIIDVFHELCEDSSVPKNVKAKFQGLISLLEKPGELCLKVNKILHDLDEIGDDINLQPYVRTQIWNISSMLEKII
jgi:uncharacterized protein (UPF0147 family)